MVTPPYSTGNHNWSLVTATQKFMREQGSGYEFLYSMRGIQVLGACVVNLSLKSYHKLDSVLTCYLLCSGYS